MKEKNAMNQLCCVCKKDLGVKQLKDKTYKTYCSDCFIKESNKYFNRLNKESKELRQNNERFRKICKGEK